MHKTESNGGMRRTPNASKAKALGTIILGSSLLLPGVCSAADPAPPAMDWSAVQKLIKRVDELESEVKTLRARESLRPTLAAPAAEAAMPQETFPQISFHGFGDINYRVSNQSGSKNAFALGQLDFFVMSRLAENLSILSENVIEANEENNFGFEIERLLLQYRGTDWFNLDVGRYHTSVGYYNTAYHHGTWFQTAVGRPQFLDFEDGGGLIPAHNTGLSAHGAIPSGSLNLAYVLEVGNGRPYHAAGSGKAPVLNISDDNEYKCVNLALTIKPDGLPGWQAGVGAYHDTITPDNLSRTDELLIHGHVVFKNSLWEFLNEGLLMRHSERLGPTHYTPAAYTQLARNFGKLRPFVRFSYVNGPDADPALSLIGANGLRWGPSIGVRYDFSTLACLKFQYDRIQRGVGEGNINQFTTQLAFTF